MEVISYLKEINGSCTPISLFNEVVFDSGMVVVTEIKLVKIEGKVDHTFNVAQGVYYKGNISKTFMETLSYEIKGVANTLDFVREGLHLDIECKDLYNLYSMYIKKSLRGHYRISCWTREL